MNFYFALSIVVACLVVSVESFQQHHTKITQQRHQQTTLDFGLSAVSRREWLAGAAFIFPSLVLGIEAVQADDATGVALPLEMKEFVDPQGLFQLRVPKNFYTLRRTQKGDLPDSKTGKGRRGSSIFTAGNMAKAEVVAVERYPARVLLEENGIVATGDLSTFPAIGDARAVANLLVIRREKETQSKGARVFGDVKVSPDGKELSFILKTEIDVQKPELLMEQFGISQLFRVTVAKASLNSKDGNLLVIFASALEQDFNNGVDGPALEDTVNSFVANEQSALTVAS